MARGAAGTVVVRVAASAVALVAALVLARELGPGGYGSYAAAIALVAGLAQPCALGLDVFGVREAAVRSAGGEWGPLRALQRRGGLAVVAVSVLVALVAAGIAEAVGGDSRLARDIQLALPLLPVTALTLQLAGALQGLQRVTESLVASILAPRVAFLAALGGALLAADGLSSRSAVLLQVAAGFAGLALALVLLRRALPPAGRHAEPAEPPSGWLRASLPLGLATGLTIAAWHVSTLAAAALGSAAEAGLYAAAAQVSVVLVILFEAVRTPLAPMVARLWATDEHARLQRGVTAATRRLFGATVVLAILVAALAEPLLSLFGDGFEDGAAALRVVALAQVVNAAAAFNGLVLTMTGHEDAVARASVAAFAVTVAALVPLVPALGAEGAALGLLAGTLARNVVNAVQAQRLTGLDTTAVGAWSRA